MNTADYVVIAIVLISSIIGILRGFLREVVSVLSWLVALYIAWSYSEALAPHLGSALSDPQLRIWAARIILFFAVLLVGAVIGALLSHFVRLSLFSGTDRFLGFLFGLLRAAVALGALVMLADLLRMNDELWWRESVLIPYAEQLGDVLRALLGTSGEKSPLAVLVSES